MLVTMRLSLSIAVFTFVTYVTGLPSHHVIPRGEPQLPLLDPGMTIKEAARKCGDEAQLSCCGRVVKAGDVTSVDEGIGSGLLSNLAGGGSGISSILAFDQCSKLDAQIAVLIVPVQNLLNQHCKQNVACCQKNPADSSSSGIAASLPCIALGSIA
ncbi:hydrophobin [Aspergillus lentulus]|uniref:Hydrophobin n=1 Tax=Aspergillus lentulus TaxID=293939 RepID=A0AAN4PSR5_ASPLE|nr:hydrophobin [Aspergillus lentulus]